MSAGQAVRLPRRLPNEPADAFLDRLVGAMELALARLAVPAGAGKYAVTNLQASRSLDATGATPAQALAVLGTLITDLKAKGSIL